MKRRGDGIGVEVLPGELRGVRLQQDAPGRVAAVGRVVCDSSDDAALVTALSSLLAQLGGHGVPARACAWASGGQLQSIDITGLSPVEVNVHRSTMDDVAATMELVAGPRRLLTHIRADMSWWLRVEHALREAGFELDAIEPTPVAIARLIAEPTAQLVAHRAGSEAWTAVVHDRVLLAAAPHVPVAGRRVGAVGELIASEWAGSVDDLRERLSGGEELSRQIAATIGQGRWPSLQLVNDAYPEYSEAELAWGPRMAGALGSAVAAAGVAGRVFPVELMPNSRAMFEDVGAWVVERVGDVEPEPAEHSRRRRRR